MGCDTERPAFQAVFPSLGCLMSNKFAPAVVPQLLVSVRNAAEARVALAGGCDILDVKEPLRGPLGMADPTEIAAVLQVAGGDTLEVPVSAALGDAWEWEHKIEVPKLPAGLGYVKLGTTGLAARGDWKTDWRRVAERWNFSAGRRRLVNLQFPRMSAEPRECPDWILVAYADWQAAEAPSPEDVLRGAIDLGCCGVLIDTWQKGQPGLLHWLDAQEISRLGDQAHAAGMTFALAGRLKEEDLPQLRPLGADVLGIRGAACRGNVREAALDTEAIRRFKRKLTRMPVEQTDPFISSRTAGTAQLQP